MTEQEEKDSHHKHHPDGDKAHFCLEFDGMYICDQCPEFDVCLCYSDECDVCLGRKWIWTPLPGGFGLSHKMRCRRCDT